MKAGGRKQEAEFFGNYNLILSLAIFNAIAQRLPKVSRSASLGEIATATTEGLGQRQALPDHNLYQYLIRY